MSVDTGLRAAEKLQSLLDRGEQGDDVVDMRRRVNLILEAVKSTVPQEMWGAIAEKLDEYQQLALGVDDKTDDVEDVFDPRDCDDMDDAM